MKQGQPAKKGKQRPHHLSPIFPGKGSMGRLKDMAQEIISASAGLQVRGAPCREGLQMLAIRMLL